jgi:hypothetical protein
MNRSGKDVKPGIEAFTEVVIQVEVVWVVTPFSVVGYQRFRGPCCLHLQGEE